MLQLSVPQNELHSARGSPVFVYSGRINTHLLLPFFVTRSKGIRVCLHFAVMVFILRIWYSLTYANALSEVQAKRWQVTDEYKRNIHFEYISNNMRLGEMKRLPKTQYACRLLHIHIPPPPTSIKMPMECTYSFNCFNVCFCFQVYPVCHYKSALVPWQ